MNKNAQLVCAHSAIFYVVFVGLGVFIMPGWLPPPSPALSSAAVSAMFQNHLVLRLGMAVMITASVVMLGLPAAITAQMRRIEGPQHVLADVQFGLMIIAAITVLMSGFFWMAASFRPNINPDLIVAFNDLGWFIIVSDGPPVMLQGLIIGFCILGNPDQKVYPRWLGYFNYWIAVLTTPAMATFFFKTGPLAWNGVIGFWIPVPLYFLWWILMYIYTLKAIRLQEA
jgi:hypothetical protein